MEIVACCEAILEFDKDAEIVVNDSHSIGLNIDFEALPEQVELIRRARLIVNGKRLGKAGIAFYIASYYGVPFIFASARSHMDIRLLVERCHRERTLARNITSSLFHRFFLGTSISID